MKTTRVLLVFLLVCGCVRVASAAPNIVSLDASRTGDGGTTYGQGYLTSPAMSVATQVLLDAGFTVGTAPDFLNSSTSGAQALFTGFVSVPFSAQEISDVKAFVAGGGGLVVLRDWGTFYPAADPLAAAFGVSYDTVGYGIGGAGAPVNKTSDSPIWSGPAGAVTSYQQWFSAAVVGATPIGVHSTNPDKSAIAVESYGLGRVVFLTDMGAWRDRYGAMSPGNANAVVWENIFHYVTPEPATLSLFALTGLLLARRRRA